MTDAADPIADARAGATAIARCALLLYGFALLLNAVFHVPALLRDYHEHRDARSGEIAEFWTRRAQGDGARLLVSAAAALCFLVERERVARWLSRPTASPGLRPHIDAGCALVIRLWGLFELEYAVFATITAVQLGRLERPLPGTAWQTLWSHPFDWAKAAITGVVGVVLLCATASAVRVLTRGARTATSAAATR